MFSVGCCSTACSLRGIATPVAISVAGRFQDALQFNLGGAKVYFAKRSNAAQRAARARALRSDGMRVKDIAARMGLSVSSTYELLRDQPRAIERGLAADEPSSAVSRGAKVLPLTRSATAGAGPDATPPDGPPPLGE